MDLWLTRCPALPFSPLVLIVLSQHCGAVQSAYYARKRAGHLHSDACVYPFFLCLPPSLSPTTLRPMPSFLIPPPPPLSTVRACYALSGELQDLFI